jgi:hypothetical protein
MILHAPTGNQGHRNHKAKLSEAIVLDCRRRHRRGATTADLAREHGVTYTAMYWALVGVTWTHVGGLRD